MRAMQYAGMRIRACSGLARAIRILDVEHFHHVTRPHATAAHYYINNNNIVHARKVVVEVVKRRK